QCHVAGGVEQGVYGLGGFLAGKVGTETEVDPTAEAVVPFRLGAVEVDTAGVVEDPRVAVGRAPHQHQPRTGFEVYSGQVGGCGGDAEVAAERALDPHGFLHERIHAAAV